MSQDACGDGGRDRVPLKSPVDIETFQFEDDDGTEITCRRATMVRERENGPVTIVEELVAKDGELVQHKRTCNAANGESIEQVHAF